MSWFDRFIYGIAGGFLGAVIAMSIVFWIGFENNNLVFKILIPMGLVGGFFLGKSFYEFLTDLFRKLWL